MIGRKLFERSDPDQLAAHAGRPQRHLRIAQAVERQNMAGFRRGSRMHLVEMEGEERLHVGALEVIGMKDERHRGVVRVCNCKGGLFERKVQDA
jgi:hypothetical protein